MCNHVVSFKESNSCTCSTSSVRLLFRVFASFTDSGSSVWTVSGKAKADRSPATSPTAPNIINGKALPNCVEITESNSPIYAEVIDPIRPDMLQNPSADALNTVGNNSAVIRYAKKKAMVVKNFPPIAKVIVNQLRDSDA